MSRRLLLAVVFTTVATIAGTAVATPFHSAWEDVRSTFEKQKAGEQVDDWFVPNAGAATKATITTENPGEGKHCVMLVAGRNDDGPVIANMMRVVPANDLKGRKVRFRALVRVEGADTRAQLWMRVDRKNQQMGFFDNMSERPITSNKWRPFEIAGDVDTDAEQIAIGCLLFGAGKVFLDDISLSDAGKVGEGNEPARELSERGLQNLTAFAKLLGYLRFFHPSDTCAETDWATFAMCGVHQVENAKNPKELVDVLSKLVTPIAPTVQIYLDGAKPPLHPALTPAETAGLRIMAWRHFGVGLEKNNVLYSSKRLSSVSVPAKERDRIGKPSEVKEFDLGLGVKCIVPASLYADTKGTLPHNMTKPFPNSSMGKPDGFLLNGNDRTTRLADVMLAWTVFQHFYPYFDVVKTDWNLALANGLKSAALDRDADQFLITLQRMVAALKDGHGGVYMYSLNGKGKLPILVDWVEDKLVVSAVHRSARTRLAIGDRIVSIDGKPAADLLLDLESRISGATPQWIRHRALSEMLIGPTGSESKLLVLPASANAEKTISLKFTSDSWQLREERPAKIAEIKPGVWYVDIDRINDKDFRDAVPKLEKAKGIVYDLRGYPSKLGTDPIAHMIDKPVRSAKWNVPVAYKPDRSDVTFEESGWPVMPKTPKFTAKIAFITGGGAISYAETYMGIIEHNKLASIVGETTAGTNGNINPFTLPGGYSISWTGMKVLKHDGSQHHGIGIKPTHPVQRTIKGIREGRDEYLEKAVEVVTSKP